MISDEKKEDEKEDGEGGEEEGEERLRTEMNRTQNHTHDPPLPPARTQISPRRLLHQVPASCEQREAETTENQTIFFFSFHYFIQCSRPSCASANPNTKLVFW